MIIDKLEPQKYRHHGIFDFSNIDVVSNLKRWSTHLRCTLE